jgi:hypothetical protein
MDVCCGSNRSVPDFLASPGFERYTLSECQTRASRRRLGMTAAGSAAGWASAARMALAICLQGWLFRDNAAATVGL